ncbi:hypothetical protein D512_28263 [Burkholderia pseudomallei MSHR1043]|nr:hypothetical protein D512_28263 [Burkholderia pseudomallei MSHR1043]
MRTRNEHDYSPERGRYRSSVATRAASAGALSGRARSSRNCKGRARENGGRRRAATDARDRRRRTQRACRAQRSRSPARRRPAGGARARRVTCHASIVPGSSR